MCFFKKKKIKKEKELRIQELEKQAKKDIIKSEEQNKVNIAREEVKKPTVQEVKKEEKKELKTVETKQTAAPKKVVATKKVASKTETNSVNSSSTSKKVEPAKKAEDKESAAKYHVSQNKDKKSEFFKQWRVRKEGSQKTIKYFQTQEEAIVYAKTLAKNNDSNIVIHKVDGTIRKQNY